MTNLFDYLEWRGDLSFSSDGLNEVDNLIFSELSYLKLDGIVPKEINKNSITLSNVAKILKQDMEEATSLVTAPFSQQIISLFKKAIKTKRFKNLLLSGYIDKIDYENSTQFAALLFSLGNGQYFIAFRGTDNTLAGWKEDLHMSFMEEVLAQRMAVDYVTDIITNIPGTFYLGGHSKGGNLAVYAATHLSESLRDRILEIYNNDGPGFQTNIIQSEGYQFMLSRINTFVPKSSVVGILLEHGEEYKIVNSYETGIMQHNALSWEIKGPSFVYEKELTKYSRRLDNTLRSWLNHLSMENREQFIEVLFELLQKTGAQTINELSKEKLKLIDSMIRTYKTMDSVSQSLIKKTIIEFFKESSKVIKKSISSNIASSLSPLNGKLIHKSKRVKLVKADISFDNQ